MSSIVISPEDLKSRLENEPEAIKLIDVREDWEFEENGLTDFHLSLYELEKRIDTIKSWNVELIVLYCNTGIRGNVGTKYLRQQGITHVLNLEGGLQAYLASQEAQR